MASLRGKVAIVTGASSGVGWQSAIRLAEAGVKLCVTARRESALRLLCVEITARGGECIAVPGDVTVDEDVIAVVDRCVGHYGRVDLLVNDAAVQAYDWSECQAWEDIERIFDVTFFGQLRFARAVLPHFRVQRSGHVLIVGSMLARGAAPLLSAYAAAKHALYGWTKTLALELHGSGIDVSIVQLPSLSTPMFDHARTALDFAPQPVPPTYDTDVAARAIVRCARHPRFEVIPVFLQGWAALTLDGRFPWLSRAVMSRVGALLQMRDAAPARDEGNLFEPVARGVGPYGSVPPTPRWKLVAATAALGVFATLSSAVAALAARRVFASVR